MSFEQNYLKNNESKFLPPSQKKIFTFYPNLLPLLTVDNNACG